MKQEYICVKCGLRVSGTEHTDGSVVASNGPPNGLPPKDSICMACIAEHAV